MSKVVHFHKNVGTTLGRFIREQQNMHQHSSGELSQVLRDLAFAAKIVHREVNRAGLADILGGTGQKNIQGEKQQKLDAIANILFKNALKYGGEIAGLISEEDDTYVDLSNRAGKYLLAIDPLDGSSNIPVNISIGTIFSIYRRISDLGAPVQMEDFLQKGTSQVAAGYLLYGSSTMLVYSAGHGVHGFTYEPSLGDFFLSHFNLKLPESGSIYSINDGLYENLRPSWQKYIDKCRKKQLTARYVGSLVADFHRNMLKGGIYLYPDTKKMPQGKLRLLYECNALAFLAEEMGGSAINGQAKRILEVLPTDIHQRTPFVVGSKSMVRDLEACLAS